MPSVWETNYLTSSFSEEEEEEGGEKPGAGESYSDVLVCMSTFMV